MRKITSLAVAACLTLVLAGSTFAAGGTSAETFTVSSSIVVTGIPANINYGALTPGVTSAVQTVPMLVSGNVPWTLAVTATDFARNPGPGTIGKDARLVSGNNSTWIGSDDTSTLSSLKTGAAGSNVPATVWLKVLPPTNAAPGSYEGSVTFTFTAS